MSEDHWTAVDGYLSGLFIAPDPVLEAALRASAEAGLPPIQVSALQGKLLGLLARAQGAARILEVGTLGGYSTIWLGRALPAHGRLVTLELDPTHAEVARANLASAGLGELVEVRLGPAAETLAELVADRSEPFDFVFIDADKEAIPEYFRRALELSRSGTVIVVDNVVRGGEVADATSTDPATQGIRQFNQTVASHPGVDATVIQTVGSKGHDGFALVLVGTPKPGTS
ncbi:MAG TPA: O-methyltransferase [Acidimicrobiales bacterium]|nr:O-methyltransferase [Acidimicrobiales bacterium]